MNIARRGDGFDVIGLSQNQLEGLLYKLDYDALDVSKVLKPPSDMDVTYHPGRARPYSISPGVHCSEARALEKLTEEHGPRVAAHLMALARIEGRILAEANRLINAAT